MTLIVEDGTGVTDAQCYVTVNDVTNYHTGSTSAAAITWAGLTDSQKEWSIAMAARILNTYFDYVGDKQYDVNDLEWPRTGAVSRCTSLDIAEGYIPNAIKNANAELAVDVAANDVLRSNDNENSQLSGLSIDSIKMTFDTKIGEGFSGGASTIVSPHVKTILRCLGAYKGYAASGIRFGSLVTTSN